MGKEVPAVVNLPVVVVVLAVVVLMVRVVQSLCFPGEEEERHPIAFGAGEEAAAGVVLRK